MKREGYICRRVSYLGCYMSPLLRLLIDEETGETDKWRVYFLNLQFSLYSSVVIYSNNVDKNKLNIKIIYNPSKKNLIPFIRTLSCRKLYVKILRYLDTYFLN